MTLNHLIETGDNPDITDERKKATFSTKSLAAILYGEKLSERRREISAELQKRQGLLDPVPPAFMSRPEKLDNAVRKTEQMMKESFEFVDPTDRDEMEHLASEVFTDTGFPLSLHFVMFIPALTGQADDEQLEEWMPKVMNLEYIGTYAQTELGHGTNLRALETRATYDRASDSFDLHSPTVTSLKWWPGNLAKIANVAVVSAQLYIGDKCHGLHNFFVPLRDPNTHQPLPGITVGDIGPKFALPSVDNGFLKMDHVRIPRGHMLMRHAKISSDGVYSSPVHPKLSYGAMIFVRTWMIRQQARDLQKAVTIAIRYSTVRRQGEITPGKGEVKVLDYQTQQYRLFPQLAKAFAFDFAARVVQEMYTETSAQVKNGNADQLADLHSLLSGMKSVVTYMNGSAIEQCRMACGGHGYSLACGISEIYATAIGGCTYEGENMVMMLQQARSLMKAARDAKSHTELSPMISYLLAESPRNCGFAHTITIESMLNALEFIARNLVLGSAERLSALEKRLPKEHAWNQNAVEMTRASRAHTRLWIAKCFSDGVRRIEDGSIREVITQLLKLYLSFELVDMRHYLCQNGFATVDDLSKLKDYLYDLLAKIRPNAVSLVDSFDLSDHALRSVLGRRDGNVYDALLAWAQSNPLNEKHVLPSFKKYIQPLMENARSKL